MGVKLSILALLLAVAAPVAARAPSLVPADAPERSAPGPLPVGVRELRFAAAPGRTLGLTLWYPAAAASAPTRYPHQIVNPPAGVPEMMIFEGTASADAAPAAGPRLPLLLFSHGLGRWSTAMSGMAENMASRGYVVASIDHDDQGAQDPAKWLQVFATAFVRRSADQRAAIAWLQGFARGKDPLAARIDATNIAVIGYSMGGYGALATGGAGYARSGPMVDKVPAGSMDAVLEGAGADPAVKALVLLAPWGGGADVRAWTPAALASVRAPSLWVMGDQDDVAMSAGIRWLHDAAVHSDRRLIVFANARHNVGGNPPPAAAPDTGRLRDMLDEAAWRKDMMDAIIFRQMGAFLDLTLKGDASAAQWLDADDKGALKGFQKRWQLGLTATHTPAR